MRGRCLALIPWIALLAAAPAFAAVDGTWRFREPASPTRVVIEPGGATSSFVVDFDGTPVTFSGTVTTGGPFTLTANVPSCVGKLTGHVLAGDTLIDALAGLGCSGSPAPATG
jgi:hypothetical protein